MKLGLFVEGPSDRRAIEILARKALGRTRTGLEPRELIGGVRSFDAIRSNVEALLLSHRDVSKVIVCADEHSDPVIKRQIRTTDNALKSASLPVPVRYVKVLHALEGWLLADPAALQQAFGGNAALSRIPGNLESRCDQVEILETVFRANRREYDKVKWAPLIANWADPAAIAAKMSSFQEFLNALTDP